MVGEINKRRVCVTGGTGFLGSWMVKRLLEHGYSVNTTTRIRPERKRDMAYLRNLEGASERLEIFDADLDRPESFAAAIEGCVGVFHVAHPLDFEDTETEHVRTERVVKGAVGILQACVQAKTVRRVVYCSSVATAVFNDKVGSLESVDESSWTDVEFLRSLGVFGGVYMVTKTLTEKTVLDFAERTGLDVVAVLPSWIHGPFISPYCPDSVAISMALILGNEKSYQRLVQTSLVHVDDVEYPQYHLPSKEVLKDLIPVKFPGLSSQKLIDTGFKYENGLKEMFDGAIKSCKQMGLL